ncbi:MAG: deoxyribose-phosphate aldolase [Planctomycetota bacterium]|jgi:deoxyribose-phosphate aldolase
MDAPTRESLGKMIDHAVLAPDATEEDLRTGCQITMRYAVASLCARPCDVKAAAQLLSGTEVALGTVIGFPHGSAHTEIKLAETQRALADGADELDMVMNIGRLRSGEVDFIRDEIAAVVQAAQGRIVKVILECCYLDREQMAAGSRAAIDAGAQFVKTSTGFGSHGARVEDVRFLRSQVGEAMGVKAAGGIRTLADALAMIDAGANRIGTSGTELILEELPA